MKTEEQLLMGPVIVTRYLGPTNHRGSRVVATHKRDADTTWRAVVDWDHAMDSSDNHQTAAQKLLSQWPYDNDLEIVSRGHDYECYYWFCHSKSLAEAKASDIVKAIAAHVAVAVEA